jgi:hypothetical protein
VPVDDAAVLDAFARDFCLTRGIQPGLSLVVPYPDPELTPDAIVPSIVRHYFLPIIRRDLEVEVVRDGTSIQLNGSTLSRFLQDVPWDDRERFQRLVDLVKWGLAIARSDHAGIAEPSESNAPRWTDHSIGADEVARLKERLNSSQRIALTVPVWVKSVAGAFAQVQGPVRNVGKGHYCSPAGGVRRLAESRANQVVAVMRIATSGDQWQKSSVPNREFSRPEWHLARSLPFDALSH